MPVSLYLYLFQTEKKEAVWMHARLCSELFWSGCNLLSCVRKFTLHSRAKATELYFTYFPSQSNQNLVWTNNSRMTSWSKNINLLILEQQNIVTSKKNISVGPTRFPNRYMLIGSLENSNIWVFFSVTTLAMSCHSCRDVMHECCAAKQEIKKQKGCYSDIGSFCTS